MATPLSLPPPPPFLAPLASRFPALYRTALTQCAIDNHAHPLLRASARDTLPFEGLLSEAEGEAMKDSIYTASSRLAAKQLGALFGVDFGDIAADEEREKWERLKHFRVGMDYDALCRVSFDAAGIHSILIDDGLGGGPGGMASLAEGYKWHDTLTAPGRTKRIVRVEVEAENILRSLFTSSTNIPDDLLLTKFERTLQEHLTALAGHEDVVGFKSIVCYRTGLNVSLFSGKADKVLVMKSLRESYRLNDGQIRLAGKSLNDEVVRIALYVAGEQGIPGESFASSLSTLSQYQCNSTPASETPTSASHSRPLHTCSLL